MLEKYVLLKKGMATLFSHQIARQISEYTREKRKCPDISTRALFNNVKNFFPMR